MTTARTAISLLAVAITLGACSSKGDISLDRGVGISAVRSACPTVGVPAGTGDVTLFSPASSTDSRAIDVTAVMTHVRSTCGDSGDQVVTNVTFDILGSRPTGEGAREVTLPYYVSVVRGGTQVVSKRTAQATLRFENGQTRAHTSAGGTAIVERSAATLPEDVRRNLTRHRKAGDDDAAIDPLSDPKIRESVLAATFEALVGFQLTEQQLAYNVTR